MLRPVAIAILALGLLSVTATAQQSGTPVPGCQGLQVTDPPGDSTVAGADVTGAWFDTVGGKVYANIAVKDLAAPSETSATQLRWYVVWVLGEGVNFVRASSDGTFAGGVQEDTGFSTVEQSIPGKFFPGADGVIQIQVPGGRAPKGKKLETPYVEVRQALGNSQAALLVATPDRAPDEGEGKSYTVQDCNAAQTPPPAGQVAPPAAQPPSGQTQADSLQVSAPAKLKAPKGKTLAVKLTSPGKVTNLSAAFGKGSKKLGSGKLATLDRKGTLKVKLARKAKKGSYTLYLVGQNPDGQRADKTFTLRLR